MEASGPQLVIDVPAWVDAATAAGASYATDEQKMALAIRLARENVHRGAGGPFGAALEDLAAARRWAATHGLDPFGETPTSFSVRDPDGHEVELYVASAARSANAG